eukprot:CAMPEP_0206218448 /NCGR_PEP_ID=MMETSP0047_2-20121206/3805_1 /ASSEMBLY_ACC=CAM_ASM_000192 /TAXON_ID=195065 /ORGANISM="Chroomonas mesostigmatica_cf, Strain CCMP1168" /LENGTH=117 /DNA_ID=CAMNT_0053640953 /DNA_START=64 /DNA_END=414 /DNA_ORIENTATION=+
MSSTIPRAACTESRPPSIVSARLAASWGSGSCASEREAPVLLLMPCTVRPCFPRIAPTDDAGTSISSRTCPAPLPLLGAAACGSAAAAAGAAGAGAGGGRIPVVGAALGDALGAGGA